MKSISEKEFGDQVAVSPKKWDHCRGVQLNAPTRHRLAKSTPYPALHLVDEVEEEAVVVRLDAEAVVAGEEAVAQTTCRHQCSRARVAGFGVCTR
jgi:hypothetical protein